MIRIPDRCRWAIRNPDLGGVVVIEIVIASVSLGQFLQCVCV